MCNQAKRTHTVKKVNGLKCLSLILYKHEKEDTRETLAGKGSSKIIINRMTGETVRREVKKA